jgi:hypothetical protein
VFIIVVGSGGNLLPVDDVLLDISPVLLNGGEGDCENAFGDIGGGGVGSIRDEDVRRNSGIVGLVERV